jgi:hypothetical protein
MQETTFGDNRSPAGSCHDPAPGQREQFLALRDFRGAHEPDRDRAAELATKPEPKHPRQAVAEGGNDASDHWPVKNPERRHHDCVRNGQQQIGGKQPDCEQPSNASIRVEKCD